jgi:predicted O-linked N-acetylglucosamine transferase (SPINDLY family)
MSQQLNATQWFNQGCQLHQNNKRMEALEAFKQSLSLERNPTALSAVATLYSELGQYSEALSYSKEALELLPEQPQLIANLAALHGYLEDYQAALQGYDAALAINPNLMIPLINRGAVLSNLGKKRAALSHNKNAWERLPELFETHFNYADSLIGYFQYGEALRVCEAGLKLAPKQPQMTLQKGICLAAMQRLAEADQLIAEARQYNPAVLMDFLSQLKTVEDAKSMVVDARHIYLESKYKEKQVCYWNNLDTYETFMEGQLESATIANSPFSDASYAFQMLSSRLSNEHRLQIGQLISRGLENAAKQVGLNPMQHVRKVTAKIRIAYISPDFRQHATAILTRLIYGLHDRSQFEVFGYSLHNEKMVDQYRKDIEAACDVFVDASELTATQLAKKIKDDAIDILIDLAGYTTHSKFQTFMLKPAPIQMTYLGYQSTSGADLMDYALVDRVICPEGMDSLWQEKLIRLPNSIWPYDNSLINAPTKLRRADYGLPDDRFVFCSLNNNYKIEPLVFSKWMNILKAVTNSVLWLLTSDVDTEDNLIREAVAQGVAKERLIFAHRAPLEQHVARFQLADIFLDSRWHNAHTTGAEALWQGLPLITCMSEQTSSRGAGSLLYALEMPELVVDSFEAYEELAIFYATHPDEYLAMREKLKAKRYTAPLFDIKLKVKHLERAYQMAWQRYQSGLPPEAINVPI